MDLKKDDDSSKALWIPLIWMFFAGSRYLSQWLDIGTPIDTLDVYAEGNPVNMFVFLVLIMAGIIVLIQRRVDWGRLFLENKWIALFFLFGAISILWSDYPFVSFKRLIKAMGNVVMALVILTESQPYVALGVVLRRFAFLVLPLSVLFIKYYPDLGRAYHMGMPMFTGVSTQKNSLGESCLIAGIYFSWCLLITRREEYEQGGGQRILVDLGLMAIITWLLYMANSATSWACLVVAMTIFIINRLPALTQKPRLIIWIGGVCVSLFGLMELSFDITGAIISMLGRDATLTTRVPMWEDLLAMVRDPILGFGYESFWLGERQLIIHQRWGIALSAHNGYLELYLNLGLIGLFILAAISLSGLHNVSRHLTNDYKTAILRLSFIVVIAIYNWTEATFYGVSNMWLMLFLACIPIPKKHVKKTTV
jgi:O-antigen ligase